ncbi:esterase/lipase [Frankia torreyi]|uniref:Esterase/lipase n=2 Tax=Frankia TaxID=1854 RepID=A0A0D8BEI7_9ACTN|nr:MULTISPECIES: alpha/beta hydrolase fold domain-containing protein [Frankia]KJE22374.1 esterase/lipase [Frankia torreyi]
MTRQQEAHGPAHGRAMSTPLPERLDPQLRARFLHPPQRRVLDQLWPGGPATFPQDAVVGVDPGHRVPVRSYRPADGPDPAPAVLFVHGSGFTMGELEQFDPHCDWYARAAEAVVVSVGYRLAPTHPYPAALQDAAAAWQWLHDTAAQLGVDPTRSAIVGSSAGAAIAAGLALYLRDHGQPLPSLLLLHAPVLDDRHRTASSHAINDERTWHRAASLRGWTSYLGPAGPPGGESIPAYAAPARATDLAGLPPTFFALGDLELARDEVLDFATR